MMNRWTLAATLRVHASTLAGEGGKPRIRPAGDQVEAAHWAVLSSAPPAYTSA